MLEMENIQYILIDTGSESNRINMSDVGKMDHAVQVSHTHRPVNKLVDFLIHAHFSYAVAGKVDLPGKSIWKKYCVLEDFITDPDKEYHVVVVNNAIHRLSVKYLNKLSEKKNVHLYSLLLDPFMHLPKPVRNMITTTKFDRVYSFQKSDCEKYGFAYTNQIYSKADMTEFESGEKESDIYYIGAEKGRMKDIYAMYDFLSRKGFKCEFTVVVKKKDLETYRQNYQGIDFTTERIPYSEILKKINKTKCILELCQKGQDGLTMRFYEALFYNKYLITNNVSAKEHPYFDDRYMQVIKSVHDIEVSKIKPEEIVDYQYNNELSPVFFMEALVKG